MLETETNCLAPILKWGGGKRQLLDEIIPRIPSFSRYYEPFLGGAAVLLGLKPKHAVVNDFNPELINTYRVIKEHPTELIECLKKHKESNSVEYYYEIRSWDRNHELYDNLSDIERAARTIYLNRTCFNGLYRVNLAGCFNTPCGKYKNPEIVNMSRIIALHDYFSSNDIVFKCGDYKDALKGIRSTAFVYFDPPYMPPENGDETFVSYTVDKFGVEQQNELKELCDNLNKRGIKFMLSNSDCNFIKELYSEYTIEIVQARRKVSADGKKRILINEVLVTNY